MHFLELCLWMGGKIRLPIFTSIAGFENGMNEQLVKIKIGTTDAG